MPGTMLSDADYERINTVLKEKFKIDHATLQIESGSTDYPCKRSEIC
jgi:hypothetical protein